MKLRGTIGTTQVLILVDGGSTHNFISDMVTEFITPFGVQIGNGDIISLSTLHFLKFPENSFEVLKLLENSVEVLKILENKLESMKILENKLESLKLQENQPVDGLVPLSIKKFTSESVLARLLKIKDNNF
ncbi:hypothetical protein Tco_1083184 [Tanacetum coccineum]|uniref:Uncharacterized protein n=1 Tax=Tanacetum coccineum TaxID=301880 RepID=A0ABQ5I3E6_9ASTR